MNRHERRKQEVISRDTVEAAKQRIKEISQLNETPERRIARQRLAEWAARTDHPKMPKYQTYSEIISELKKKAANGRG